MTLRACGFLLLLAVVPAAQVRKLNGPLAAVFDGDVSQFWTGPDSSRVFYTADQDAEGVLELYCVPADGSAPPSKLFGDPSADVIRVFPGTDGARVAFVVDPGTLFGFDLYGAPSDASLAAVRLNGTTLVDADSVRPTATRAVYFGFSSGSFGLFTVLLDGSAAPVAFPLPAGFGTGQDGYALSPDGSSLAYAANMGGPADPSHAAKLLRAPVDASSPPVVLASYTGGAQGPAISRPRFSPDGKHILFQLYQDGLTDLYSVPSSGGALPAKVGPAPGADYFFTPDGKVVYSDLASIYSVPLDGSASATTLASLGSPNTFVDYGIGVGRVAYLATFGGVREVYSVPIDGSSAPIKLNAPFVSGGAAGVPGLFAVTPDGRRVLYQADAETDEVSELYSVPIDGSAAPVKLSGVLAPGGDVVAMGSGLAHAALVLPDSSRIVYVADASFDEVFELYSAPVDGSAPPVKLDATPGSGGDVTWSESLSSFPRLLPDGSRVVYHADQEQNEVFELFSVAPAGGTPAKLNGPLLAGAVVGDVADFRYSPDSTEIVYRADGSEDDIRELFVAGVRVATPPLRLDPAPLGGAAEYTLLDDGSRVALRTASSAHEIFSAPLDGSAPMVKLDPATLHNPLERFAVAPLGGRVVFVTDALTLQVFELFSVPADGSAAPIRISGPMTNGGDVSSTARVRISPDGTRVVYRADQDSNNVQELYSTSIDGSASPVKLNAPLVAGGQVSSSFEITPDSSRVVFLADARFLGVTELFVVPLDGSSPPVRLSGSLVAGGNVTRFLLTPDGGRVLYRADEITDERFELFSASLDPLQPGPKARKHGSRPGPVKLSGDMIAAGDVAADLLIAPDGSRVAFRADALADGVNELFTAPVDGSAPPVRLNAPLASGSVQPDYRFAGPDHVLYLAKQLSAGVQELFRVPSNGSTPPVRISGELVAGGDVSAFEVSSDGERVLYLADQLQDGRNELFQRDISGGLPARRASAILVAGGNVISFAFSPDARTFAYLADQDALGVVELYLGHLSEPRTRPR